MKEIKKYTSIERYGKSCTMNVLQVGDMISITEKIDGANASFRIDETNERGVSCYSRRQPLMENGNTLSGFWTWVNNNIVTIKDKLNPNYIYFGEWLLPHHVRYKQECYRNYYMFSVWDIEKEEYLSDEVVMSEAERLGLKTVPYLYVGEFISFEHLMSFVGKSNMTLEPDKGEGIVVKNVNYKNRSGEQVFVKLVSESFAEVQKQKPPKNPNIDTEFRTKLMTVLTEARVRKMIFALVEDGLVPEDFAIKDMGVILKNLGNRLYEDIMKEEAELFEGEEEAKVKRYIGKNVPTIVRRIIEVREV